MTQARNYVFTLNNYTTKELDALIGNTDYKYMIFGFEEKSTKHLQGYMEFDQQIRICELKYFPFERMHLERRKGTQKQAIEYCQKDGRLV